MEQATNAHERMTSKADAIRRQAIGQPEPLAVAMRRRACELEFRAHLFTEIFGVAPTRSLAVA